MKKLWNRPITWGDIITLSGVSAVAMIPLYLWTLYDLGVNPCPKLTEKIDKLKIKIRGNHKEDEP